MGVDVWWCDELKGNNNVVGFFGILKSLNDRVFVGSGFIWFCERVYKS